MDKWKIIPLFGIPIASVSLVLTIIAYFSRRSADLSEKINAGLNLLPHCGFSGSKLNSTTLILLEAQKQLNIQNNYDNAYKLYDSVSPILSNCNLLGIPSPYYPIFVVLSALIAGMLILSFIKKIFWF